MIDLDHFKDTYFEECSELLLNAENSLLALSDCQQFAHPLDSENSETIHALFRDIHSIKGGGGAFGFTQLVNFAHDMETLLDAIRGNQIPFTHDLLSLLIESRDGLAHLVNEAQKSKSLETNVSPPFIIALSQNLVSALTSALLEKKTHGKSSTHVAENTRFQNESPLFLKTYQIKFKPHPNLLQHGNEPLYLLRELQQLGSCDITAEYETLPSLSNLDYLICYFSWHIILKTAASQDEIIDIFEFVENDCLLEISLSPRKEMPSTSISSGTTPVLTQSVLQEVSEHTDLPHIPAAQLFKTTHAPISENIQNSKIKKAISSQLYPNQNRKSPQQSSVRVHLEKIDTLVNLVGEIVIHQSMLMEQASHIDRAQADHLNHGLESLGQFTRELQDSVMAIRAQPIKTVFSRMTRIVHDISRNLNKSVQLVTIGDSCEVDKTIIEQLNDPLTHMVRNAMDHGIETQEERKAAQKSPKAIITLKAIQRKGRMIIEVQDDGRGLDRSRIFAKAIERHLVKSTDILSENETFALLLEPGFSTAEKVSDLSGRGVGLDVVKKNINAMGGSLSISSELGIGTCFKLSLPLTLAVLDGMILRIGTDNYVLPLNSIIESLRPTAQDLECLIHAYPMLRVRGDYIPIIPLYQILQNTHAAIDPCEGLIVIIEDDDGAQIGLQIDDVLGQQQVVIKSLEENYRPLPGISGATILGNGNVALIFDLPSLLQHWRQSLSSAKFSNHTPAPVPDILQISAPS